MRGQAESQPPSPSFFEIATNPIFHPAKPTKILVSPGHGAGWISWAPRAAPDAFLVWMLTYEPLILGLLKKLPRDKLEDLLVRFHHEAKEKFGVERMVCSRVRDLVVQEMKTPLEIRDIDGEERIVDISRRKIISM